MWRIPVFEGMKDTHKFDDKSILIWGYGREGKSTEQFLKKCCKPKKIEIFEGKKEEISEDLYDYIIKSPGIVMDEYDPKVTSQTEIFLEAYRDNTIGISGTKGKSTTASMLYQVLSACLDSPVILLGNIGEPCLNHYEEIGDDTIVVFEMSCHQLMHTKVSPHIAVFLNLYEEHLDYYKTFQKYFDAKKNITAHQKDTDILYIGEQVPAFATSAQKIVVGKTGHYELGILGEHNEGNAEFVFRIATEQFGADPGKVRECLKEFKGLPHRLQFIGEKNGIFYYDDSISTIPGAAIQALHAVKNAGTILIGGMDRGINYDELIDFISSHDMYNYVCMYESGKRIYQALSKNYCYYEPDLEHALRLAEQITQKGSAIILSPAAASYGYFKNFEERGDRFRELAFQTETV